MFNRKSSNKNLTRKSTNSKASKDEVEYYNIGRRQVVKRYTIRTNKSGSEASRTSLPKHFSPASRENYKSYKPVHKYKESTRSSMSSKKGQAKKRPVTMTHLQQASPPSFRSGIEALKMFNKNSEKKNKMIRGGSVAKVAPRSGSVEDQKGGAKEPTAGDQIKIQYMELPSGSRTDRRQASKEAQHQERKRIIAQRKQVKTKLLSQRSRYSTVSSRYSNPNSVGFRNPSSSKETNNDEQGDPRASNKPQVQTHWDNDCYIQIFTPHRGVPFRVPSSLGSLDSRTSRVRSSLASRRSGTSSHDSW